MFPSNFKRLKKLPCNRSTIQSFIPPLDYTSAREIILQVDSSHIAVRYILSQIGADSMCYLNSFDFITSIQHKVNYSQLKFDLYILFQPLKTVREHIISKINNPVIQPNDTINTL
jgi:hypothetical protein